LQRTAQGPVMTREASSERISALLGIHERVLRRRLRAEGTSIHNLIGAARFELARQLLSQTHLSLAEIASAPGLLGRHDVLPGIPRLGEYHTQRAEEPD
jgi:hypothetical protein